MTGLRRALYESPRGVSRLGYDPWCDTLQSAVYGVCEESAEKCLPFIPLFGKIISVFLHEEIVVRTYEAS